MKIITTTPRLIIRELEFTDDAGMFEMDSNPEVLKYIGTPPLTHIDESRKYIEFIRKQYRDNGTGRWAVTLKDGTFIGWAGIKLLNQEVVNNRIDFYELGYRFIPRFWGAGYGFEAASACTDYAFREMHLPVLYAYIDRENAGSARILTKIGFQFVEYFDYNESIACAWYEMHAPLTAASTHNNLPPYHPPFEV